MKEHETKNEKDMKSKNHSSDSGDEIEVEIKGSQADERPDEPSEPESGGDQESSEEVAEPVSLEDQLREKEDRYLRLAAEFDNYKKRTTRQFASMMDSAQAEIFSEILTIQDNFERALQVEDNSGDYADFKKGVELIFAQLADLLKKHGVEPFESAGERFDPNLHEALMTVESDDHEEGVIVEELTKGYKFKDRVLRHAKVSVAQDKNDD